MNHSSVNRYKNNNKKRYNCYTLYLFLIGFLLPVLLAVVTGLLSDILFLWIPLLIFLPHLVFKALALTRPLASPIAAGVLFSGGIFSIMLLAPFAFYCFVIMADLFTTFFFEPAILLFSFPTLWIHTFIAAGHRVQNRVGGPFHPNSPRTLVGLVLGFAWIALFSFLTRTLLSTILNYTFYVLFYFYRFD